MNSVNRSPRQQVSHKVAASHRSYIRCFHQTFRNSFPRKYPTLVMLLTWKKSAEALVDAIFRVFISRSPEFYLELCKSLVLSRFSYCCLVWRPFLKTHLVLLESVKTRFRKRLEWGCGLTPIRQEISEISDQHDMRLFCSLRQEGLLDHFFTCRSNSLRSGISSWANSTPPLYWDKGTFYLIWFDFELLKMVFRFAEVLANEIIQGTKISVSQASER